MPQSKTSEAQAEAFKESLRETAALLRDVGITKAIEPHILNFVPASTMKDWAAAARKPLVLCAETTRPTTTQRGRNTQSPTSSRRAAGHGCCRAQDNEHHRRDGGHRRKEGQNVDADERRLVLLAVVRAHLP
eukprot:6195524-Pleurochrysis_carterae.AAC.1